MVKMPWEDKREKVLVIAPGHNEFGYIDGEIGQFYQVRTKNGTDKLYQFPVQYPDIRVDGLRAFLVNVVPAVQSASPEAMAAFVYSGVRAVRELKEAEKGLTFDIKKILIFVAIAGAGIFIFLKMTGRI